MQTQTKEKQVVDTVMVHCICKNGKKVKHYYLRSGVYGPVYVCSGCGAEKTVAV